MSLTASSQTGEKDSVKISYEELRWFLEADVRATYCDTILPLKDSIIEYKDGVIFQKNVEIIDLKFRNKQKTKAIIGGTIGAAVVGVIVGLLVR